ncbi:MAG: hypothetical protein IPL61_37170 [Myxococcales bacterium]|nr:hypothetical protein [Myxococcales bacterium]
MSLQTHGSDPITRCRLCGRAAAGPCARCRRSVCGDCCVLTDGGVSTFAVCLTCADRGTSLRRSWLSLVGWLAAILIALAALGLGLAALRSR